MVTRLKKLKRKHFPFVQTQHAYTILVLVAFSVIPIISNYSQTAAENEPVAPCPLEEEQVKQVPDELPCEDH